MAYLKSIEESMKLTGVSFSLLAVDVKKQKARPNLAAEKNKSSALSYQDEGTTFFV